MLKIWFEDFWPDKDWDLYHNIFTDTFNLFGLPYTIDSETPNVVVFSHCGVVHEKYQDCTKILFATDCSTTTFVDNKCHTAYHTETCLAGKLPNKVSDGVFGYEFIDHPNYVRLPYYVLQDWFITQRFHLSRNRLNTPKSKFCCFLFQNVRDERLDFLGKLSAYKPVDSKRNSYNNRVSIPNVNFIEMETWKKNWIVQKLQFMTPYKFNMGFENILYSGYVTEKILHSFYSYCIPIYYGHSDIEKDFRKEFFIHLQDYSSFEAAIDRIREVDSGNYTFPENGEERVRPLLDFQCDIYRFFKRL